MGGVLGGTSTSDFDFDASGYIMIDVLEPLTMIEYRYYIWVGCWDNLRFSLFAFRYDLHSCTNMCEKHT